MIQHAMKTPETSSDDLRWQAVVDRDPAADGRFLYAVSSTGIYCRPTCPSRRPKRSRVAFFDSTDQARRAGYRACKRCKPDAVSPQQQLVATVQRMIDEAEVEPTLAELGAALEVSPHHLQRVFKRATGLSPKQYAIARREERLKRGLRGEKDVTTALYDAGYESSSALYARGSRRLGMSPGAYRAGGAGVEIRWAVFASELGDVLVAGTARGLVAVRIGDRDEQLAGLSDEFPRAELREDPEALEDAARSVLTALRGGTASPPALDLDPTAFQARVWRELERIPPGETRSYSEIAERIGRPGAARAVARACARNPVALVIPCHRVVSASGALAGYRWGVETKRELLAREAERASR